MLPAARKQGDATCCELWSVHPVLALEARDEPM